MLGNKFIDLMKPVWVRFSRDLKRNQSFPIQDEHEIMSDSNAK